MNDRDLFKMESLARAESQRLEEAAIGAAVATIPVHILPHHPSVDEDDDDEDDEDEQPQMRQGVSRLGISKKAWTPAEDEILTAVVEKQGPSRWSTIAHHLPGRMGKQCRERCAHAAARVQAQAQFSQLARTGGSTTSALRSRRGRGRRRRIGSSWRACECTGRNGARS